VQTEILAIAFDLDNTLYSQPSGISGLARRVLGELELGKVLSMTDSELLDLIRKGPEAWFRQFMLTNNVAPNWQPTTDIWIEYCRRLIESLGIHPCSEDMAVDLKKEWEKYGPPGRGVFRPQMVDGCNEVLWELHARGYSLGLCTNRIYNPKSVLEEDSVLGAFDSIEHSGVPGYEKPSPYLLFRFADCVGVNPRRCAYVGDRLDVDVKAAVNAGMLPVLAEWCCHKSEFVMNDILVAKSPVDILTFFP